MARLISVFSCVLFLSSVCSAANPILLFDGQTLNGWTTQKGEPVTKGWEVVDGTIHLDIANGRGGNILSDRDYGDFDLRFEWKISEGGNSGIKYRVKEFPGRGFLGCEYQILDDEKHGDGKNEKTSTGSLYHVYAPTNKHLNPPGQFNHSRVVVSNNYVQHWLNGILILTAQIGSPDWEEKVADSKFHDVEGFGLNQQGRIMLTDHSSEVWYRNIYLYELNTCPPTVQVSACRPNLCQPVKRRFRFSRLRFRRCR